MFEFTENSKPLYRSLKTKIIYFGCKVLDAGSSYSTLLYLHMNLYHGIQHIHIHIHISIHDMDSMGRDTICICTVPKGLYPTLLQVCAYERHVLPPTTL